MYYAYLPVIINKINSRLCNLSALLSTLFFKTLENKTLPYVL